jgi:hypothetical protein
MKDSFIALAYRPWWFVWEFIKWMLFGTGLMLSYWIEVPIFMRSDLVDADGGISVQKQEDLDPRNPKALADFELMPVSTQFTLLNLL